MRFAPLIVFVAGCFPLIAPPMAGPTGATGVMAAPNGDSQREAFARSAGYPTRKTAADLQTLIDQQLATYKPAGRSAGGALQSPEAFTIDGERHTCYKVVMHLADGAAWGEGAEAGLKFQFIGATGDGMGGPGVRGPGAVASLGCAEKPGTITMTMAPLFGSSPIGTGNYKLEVYSHKLSDKEWADKRAAEKADEEQQEREIEQQRADERNKAVAGCQRCDARYQGCIGAGNDYGTCQSRFSTCEFEEVGGGATCERPH
jgi:hypothetical protein